LNKSPHESLKFAEKLEVQNEVNQKERFAVSLEGVGFEIAGKVILKPLTISFPERGMTGLIGQNGSGKSTLMKILARQLAATGGNISYGNRPLQLWGEREFARKVAYLPQFTPLAAGLKVRELVALGRYPWHGALGFFGQIDHEKVDEALTLTSTEPFADRFVDTLSGGERQSVWLAMLIAQDARLLLLDEPISALDIAHQIGVLNLVKRLCLEKDLAAIVIIHEINLAARFCNSIAAMKNGELIGYGPPEDFMTPERLKEIYDVSMSVFARPDTGQAVAYVRQ
jgi:iron complex transport system ATP-binding protein